MENFESIKMHEEAFNAQTFFKVSKISGGKKSQQGTENVYTMHHFVFKKGKMGIQNIFVFALIFISKVWMNTHKN